MSVVYTLPEQSATSNTLEPRYLVENALAKTVQGHAGLCYGIAKGGDQEASFFERLPALPLNCEWHEHCSSDPQSTERVLADLVSQAHDQQWVPGMPAWKVIGLASGPVINVTKTLHISFVAHHAIADGLSGIAFHRSLLSNICQTAQEPLKPVTWPIAALEAHPSPVAIDSVIKLQPKLLENIDNSIPSSGPIWGGTPISHSHSKCQTRLQVIDIPSAQLSRLLKFCKTRQITLTGLLHGLITQTLARSIPSAAAFSSVTPYSIRSFTGCSADEIVNHISYMTSTTPPSSLEAFRQPSTSLSPDGTSSQTDFANILPIAHRYSSEMAAEIAQFPSGSALEDLARIPNFLAFCKAQEGQERQYTYELSNLGAVDGSAAEQIGWKMEKVVFSQCGMVAGPAMGFSCVSVRGGPLVVGVSWQRGVVGEELMEEVVEGLEGALLKLGEGDL